MRIKSASKIETSIRWGVSVYIDGLEMPFTVFTRNGVVDGDHNSNMGTHYLDYFNNHPESTRIEHFNKIKRYIENELNP